jgi:hypothetical protein
MPFGSLHFGGIEIYIMDKTILLGIWHSITFSISQISLSQIHRVRDGNGFYRSLCYNFILQLIAHSFNSLPYIRNATYKYVPCMPNNKFTNIFYIQLY